MSFLFKLPLFYSSTHPEASNSGVKPAHTTCMSKQRIKPSGRTTPGGLTTVSDSHACMGIQDVVLRLSRKHLSFRKPHACVILGYHMCQPYLQLQGLQRAAHG